MRRFARRSDLRLRAPVRSRALPDRDCASRDLGGEQPRDDAILVGGPDLTVPAKEGGAGALFAGEAERAREQPVHEPFEADWNLIHGPCDSSGGVVDEVAADDRFADRCIRTATAAGYRTGRRCRRKDSDSGTATRRSS